MEWKQSKLPEEYKSFLENGYSSFEAAALCKAKIKTVEEANDHLFGDDIISPRKIRNIVSATEIIWNAVCSGVKICVFGDYDADGITASAIMFLALKKLGANVVVRLPDRIDEGYGISLKAIKEQIELGVELFITVDNGVRAIEEAKYIKEQGKKLVVLDHHEAGELLPDADALIDLHIPGETYPYTELTGSGLAWKVAHYLLEMMNEHDFAMSLADLAAFGTIGDVAPLTGENRVIVKRALVQMKSTGYDRYGVKEIMPDIGNATAEDIAFRMAPCLNAPGRINSHGASLPLVMLLESNEQMARSLADRIIAINEERKRLQAECYKAIKDVVEERIAAGDKVLVIKAETAKTGIVGLLAGNLKEEYGRPALVFAPKTDADGVLHWVGSARSIEAFHMLNSITSCSDLLERFGGHKLAAGLMISADDNSFEEFRRRMNDCASSLTEDDLKPVSEWDLELDESEITDDLYAQIEALEPFGSEAPRPVIKVRVKLAEESHRFMGDHDQHIKLFAKDFSLVGFNLAQRFIELGLPQEFTAYGYLKSNCYRGKITKELSLLDLCA